MLYRKAKGQPSKLCFGAQVLIENRQGLCAAITVHNPIAQDEPTVALAQVDEHRELHGARITTLGGDKAYHQSKFVTECRERQVAPHTACMTGRQVPGLDGRTIGGSGYRTSQRIRKRVEEIFGWMKTAGGLRRSRYRGVERTQSVGLFRSRDLQFAADNQSGHAPASGMNDQANQWIVRFGPKSQSKPPSGSSAEPQSLLHSDE